MANNSFDFMKDVLATPLGELISSIGAGVAEAQASLDAGSLAQTLAIYNSENKDQLTTLMREVGYQPTFYALPETEVEAQISISLAVSDTYTANGAGLPQTNNISKTKIYATPGNASINNRYNLNVNAFSKIKFKIVPVPPPGESADIRVVPNLIGLTEAEAGIITTQLGLKYAIVPPIPAITPPATATTISAQTPAPGTIIKSAVELQLTM
jgi:PASTA domain